MLGAIMITAGGFSWYAILPDSAKATLASAAVLNVLIVLIFAATIIVFAMLYLGPYRNPGWLTPGFAILLFLLGLMAFSTGEFIREAIRKPFIVYNVVYGNQIFPEQVPRLRAEGYLNGGLWTRAFAAEHYPELMVEGRIDNSKLLKLPYKDRLALGEVLFMHHCNDCHAGSFGYSAAGLLLQGRPREAVLDTIKRLDDNFFMPPWCGTEQEAELLTDYLMTIKSPPPAGIRLWEKPGGANE